MIEIELRGVEVHGYHGVEEEERCEGQTFLFDVWFDVGEQALSDRIEDTVDYRSVVALIEETSDSRAFHLWAHLRMRPESLSRAVRREAVSSAAPVASGYERDLRPCLALAHRTPATRRQSEAHP